VPEHQAQVGVFLPGSRDLAGQAFEDLGKRRVRRIFIGDERSAQFQKDQDGILPGKYRRSLSIIPI
jgi:hypothetical protein